MNRAVVILINAKDRASKGFARVSRAGREMAARLRRTGAGVSRQFQGFGTVGTASIMKVVGALGALYLALKSAQIMMRSFIQTGIMGNAQMESLKVTLAATFKDMKKATEALDWAIKFAARTPFQIPEIVQATVRLETYGIKAKETLQIIGDMAAIMGKPLMQAIEAIADAQMGELERMKEFGISKRMLIEAGAKINSRGAIKDMESLNKALMRVMEDRFAGGMERMSHTFKGIVSNLQDFWGTFQRQLAEPAFEVVKQGLKDLLSWINKVKESGRFDEIVNRVAQAIGRIIKLLIALPEIFQLLVKSFVAFIKKLGDWEYASRAFVKFAEFMLVAFGGLMRGLLKMTLSLGKIVWKPLEIGFFAVMTGIVNLSDIMVTGVWYGIKWLTGKVVELFNVLTTKYNEFIQKNEQLLNVYTKMIAAITVVTGGSAAKLKDLFKDIKLPEIPEIKIPDISDDFGDMHKRMQQRSADFGQFWEQGWRETGEVAKEEGKKIASTFKDYMMTMKYTAEQTIIPVLKEAIPPEVLQRLKELGMIINAEIIPATIDMGMQTKKTEAIIRKASDLDLKAIKARAKAYQDLIDKREQADKDIFRRTIELTQSERTIFEWGLREKVHKYRLAGVNENQIDRWLAAERKKFTEDRLLQTEEMHRRIHELQGSSHEYEIERLKEKALRYIELGASQYEVDKWYAMERAQMNIEADTRIQASAADTWESITDYVRHAMGIGRSLLQMLMGTSRRTWQEMIADILEWGGQLVSQYLISKGLEMMRRAEGKKTHRDIMLQHAEEFAVMATKFALMGDIARAAAAGIAAVATGARAVALTAEIKQIENAGKRYVALGLAVEAGTMIAGEALQGWGKRASEARQRQERELQKVQQIAERTAEQRARTEQQLQDDIIAYQHGAQAKEAVLLERRRQEYAQLGIEPALLAQWTRTRQAEIAGVTPEYTVAQPLPVQIVSGITKPEALLPIPSPSADTVIMHREGGPIIQQTNYFEGLVNFDNPEAMRELARKLHPYWEELEEGWET